MKNNDQSRRQFLSTLAIGYGGRMRRISGDQFDQFSVLYEYGNGKKAHCATRQINGSDEQIKSTRIAIMGRMATYTSREVTWDEVLPICASAPRGSSLDV